MRRLRKNKRPSLLDFRRIIWLNPLAGELGYCPPFRGMETVMPYIDHFLPAENLQALNKLSRILAKEMS